MLRRRYVFRIGWCSSGATMRICLACVGCIDGCMDVIQTLTTACYIGQSKGGCHIIQQQQGCKEEEVVEGQG